MLSLVAKTLLLDAATELLAAGRLDDAGHTMVKGLKPFDPCEPRYVVSQDAG